MEQSSTSVPARASRATLPLVLGILAVVSSFPAWMPGLFSGRSSDQSTAVVKHALGLEKASSDQTASLRVVAWDETASAARLFEVKRDGDRWVIPSHHGYPADGNTRVTKTAAGLLGAECGRQIVAKPDDWASLGLVDPLEHSADAKTGFGRRVTLTDTSGATSLDIVIGNQVEGVSGLCYVREIGKSEVWTAKVSNDLSTKFTDYVELDPFKIKRDAVRGLSVLEYKVDVDKNAFEAGPVTRFLRPDDKGEWSSQQAPEGKRASRTKVDDVLGELTALRLQGVRPFDLRWLRQRGIFWTAEPQAFQMPNALTVQIGNKPYALFGTEGRLDVTTADGLRYSFMFGKVALGDEQDTDAEVKTATDKPATPAEGANRYVAVFVTYDASLDTEAKAEAEKKDAEKPAKKKLTGKDRAAKAQERYQRFFYVISDASFKKLRPELATLWEDKPKEPMAGTSGKTVKQWLADNSKLPGINTTPSGLQYQTLASGPEGGPKPTTADTVRVAYQGTLIDGTEFDANKDTSFPVTGVIKGWTEALQLMKHGDKLKLFVPPELGYGEAGSPPKIGPSQILIFEVTLHEVVGKAAAPAPKAEPAKPAEAKPEAAKPATKPEAPKAEPAKP